MNRDGRDTLSIGIGPAVVEEIFRGKVTRLAGPRERRDRHRAATRNGQEQRQLTLGGRRVAVSKPRDRATTGEELPLRTYHTFASRDLLPEAALAGCLTD